MKGSKSANIPRPNKTERPLISKKGLSEMSGYIETEENMGSSGRLKQIEAFSSARSGRNHSIRANNVLRHTTKQVCWGTSIDAERMRQVSKCAMSKAFHDYGRKRETICILKRKRSSAP